MRASDWVNAEELAPSRLMYPMISVDPGEIHVGVAVWDSERVQTTADYEYGDRWVCQDAFETSPVPFLRALQIAVGSGIVQTVVFERFVLQPTGASACLGTDMETSQMIGAIFLSVNGRCTLVGQVNSIKIPTRSVLKARKLRSVAKRLKAGGHAFDAELHGSYFILHTLGQDVVN